MSDFVLLDQTIQWLEDAPVEGPTVDEKVRQLLRSEYLHQSGQYRRLAQALSRKYRMDFDQFQKQRMVEKQGYTWEVETDAIQWETAISGIQTIERKLAELTGA